MAPLVAWSAVPASVVPGPVVRVSVVPVLVVPVLVVAAATGAAAAAPAPATTAVPAPATTAARPTAARRLGPRREPGLGPGPSSAWLPPRPPIALDISAPLRVIPPALRALRRARRRRPDGVRRKPSKYRFLDRRRSARRRFPDPNPPGRRACRGRERAVGIRQESH
ncbi:hypothetical protein; putative signal peptide [Frankia alni ACN14a]|uniref:Uncharacterized protein n=1 Tax=Frankia alni (strain DSM 45986 / CECT 9034 / ACN14a) TaxID=326424 RepID=Q0RN16_FRAAA|nr:hypothetical protein; putative signal peptide [Frankia alni ACN14a]